MGLLSEVSSDGKLLYKIGGAEIIGIGEDYLYYLYFYSDGSDCDNCDEDWRWLENGE